MQLCQQKSGNRNLQQSYRSGRRMQAKGILDPICFQFQLHHSCFLKVVKCITEAVKTQKSFLAIPEMNERLYHLYFSESCSTSKVRQPFTLELTGPLKAKESKHHYLFCMSLLLSAKSNVQMLNQLTLITSSIHSTQSLTHYSKVLTEGCMQAAKHRLANEGNSSTV